MVILLAVLLACDDPGPALPPTLPPTLPPALSPAAVERQEVRSALAEPRGARADSPYVKPAGVYIDVPHLGGRNYAAARAEVERQFGTLVEDRVREDGTHEVEFARGTLRLSGNTIQMIEVPLPRPVHRAEALAQLGFPESVEKYHALSLEFRLLNAWGFRRIRLFRAARDAEEITRVQAWRFSDSDR